MRGVSREHTLERAVRRPFAALGVVVVGVTAVTALVARNPLDARAVQTLLPLVLAALLFGFDRWRFDPSLSHGDRRTVVGWMGLGVGLFFVLGAWFYWLGRLFDTTWLLAIVDSLATGASVGGLAGYFLVESRRARRSAEEQSERLEQFASIVSHDLRNPLNVAQGHVELLEADLDDHQERLRVISNSLDRTNDIIDDVLALSREGRAVDEFEPVSLSAVVREAWRNVDTGDADLVVPTDGTVMADPARLQRLLENLLRNSVEHGRSDAGSPSSDGAAADGGCLTVRVETTAGGFAVEDDGPGIDTDLDEQILEPGVSTAEDGTGLGLAIVDRIARAHGWTLHVTTGRSGGARFEFGRVTVRSGSGAGRSDSGAGRDAQERFSR